MTRHDEILADLRLEPEAKPQVVRSGGGGGGAPIEWEKLIGPAIQANQGQDVLIQVYPKEGLPQTDEEKIAARRQAMSRAGAIGNRYYSHVPDEFVETSVRLREEGNYGVYATHHGPMTDESRAKLEKRRAPRPSKKGGEPVPPQGNGDPTAAAHVPESPSGTTAAERVRNAAKKQQG